LFVFRIVYGMKVTFEIPPAIVQKLRNGVPSGQRSKFVTEAIGKELEKLGNELEQAAHKANCLMPVNEDMKAWEALNGYED
jgi:hypothetical protein